MSNNNKKAYGGRNSRRKQNPFFRIFVPLLIGLAVLFAGILFFLDKGLIPGVISETPEELMQSIKPIAGADSDFAKEFSGSKRINVLLLGENQKLTDTIMLGSFDIELKRVDVISVPRDTYYERPNYSGAAYQKINSIYETEGVEKTAEAVSNVLGGVPIHYYEIIGQDGVAHIVDAMGGVRFDVPIDMKYDDPNQDLHIDLKAGKQVLDGDHAVQYLRFRSGYANADLGRVDAQQSFMKEAFKQSIGFGFPKVARTAMNEVITNLDTKQAVRIASEASRLSADKIETYVTPGAPKTVDGASYYIADRDKALEMMQMIYSMKPGMTGGAVTDEIGVSDSEE